MSEAEYEREMQIPEEYAALRGEKPRGRIAELEAALRVVDSGPDGPWSAGAVMSVKSVVRHALKGNSLE